MEPGDHLKSNEYAVALRRPLLTFAAAAAMFVSGAWAQPTTQEMIDQLRPARTRSLRNLTVEAAPAAVPGARPSLSLQVEFDFDSARIRPESHAALSQLGQALKSDELSGSRFAVEGHTDSKGRAEYNLRLSERRARAVRDLLASQGVDAARLVTSGKGSSEPANADNPDAPENRRVRIVNLD
jgi:OOP family OmpA-OmpF porin